MSYFLIQYLLKPPFQSSLSLTEKEGEMCPLYLIDTKKLIWILTCKNLLACTTCWTSSEKSLLWFQSPLLRQLPNKYNLWPQAGKRCQACQQKSLLWCTPEKDSTDNQLLQVAGTVQHKKSAPQPVFVKTLLPNALLTVCHYQLDWNISSLSIQMFSGRIMIQGEILASGKPSGH